jgi:hypothetical protein
MRRRRDLTREERRSLWLNRVVAGRVAQAPNPVLTHARRNLQRLERVHEGTSVMRWLRRWRDVLDAGPEAVMEMLTSTTPEAAELRQNSPFSGVLSARERKTALASFSEHSLRTAGRSAIKSDTSSVRPRASLTRSRKG